MVNCLLPVVFVVAAWSLVPALGSDPSPAENEPTLYNVDINVPAPDSSEYACSGWKVPEDELYIVNVEAMNISRNVHHIMMYGCESSTESYRDNCHAVCETGTGHVLYVWSGEVPVFQFPRGDSQLDVGFQIGGGAVVQYVVLQVHTKMPSRVTNRLGAMRLVVSRERQPLLAGVYTLSIANATIPAGSPNAYVDITCAFNEKIDANLLAYRMHTHSLGRSVTSYKVNDASGWQIVSRGNPQWIQAYYPLKDTITVTKGDYLVTRCLYDSSRRRLDTSIGYTLRDEMCNLYLLFYVNVTSSGLAKDFRNFYDCQGNNVPELSAQIPSQPRADQNRADDSSASGGKIVREYAGHEQRVGVGEGEELADEAPATDVLGDRWTRRRYRPSGQRRYHLYQSPGSSYDEWNRKFDDESAVDSDGDERQEMLQQRSRNRRPLVSGSARMRSEVSEHQVAQAAGTQAAENLLTSPSGSVVTSVATTTVVLMNSSVKPADVVSTTPTAAGSTTITHQKSVKKDGASRVSVDSGSDQFDSDTIEQNVEKPSVVEASLIVSALIMIPLVVVITVMVCSRLRKQGKCLWIGKKRSRHLNIGNLLSRGGQRNGGFRQLGNGGRADDEYRAELLDPAVHSEEESEVEEFSSSSTANQRKA